MKNKIYPIVALTLALSCGIAVAGPINGQRGSGDWGMGGAYQRMYNPATVETVSGVITAVEKSAPIKGMHYDIHLQLKTGREIIDVHLGPDWYIQRLDTAFAKGDRISVKGSRTSMGGTAVIIAGEVTKGSTTVVLRDSRGVPVWSGWRR